jgi:phosphatidate cytidylyltransferase
MSNNLRKRTITSIVLLGLLFFINFSHEYIFIIALIILCAFIFYEFNFIYTKLFELSILKKKVFPHYKKFNFNFFILNLITFFYIFIIFANSSYQIYKFGSPTLFLFFISICFFSDTGGYFLGKLIGGKKLTKISPNKTISGAFGSFLFSLIPLIIFSKIDNLDITINLKNILFCLSISLINQIGDLIISFLKRRAKVKDTGSILPGHGGVLDRLDGIIFAIPFSYLLQQII